jgi:hypothetical protein
MTNLPTFTLPVDTIVSLAFYLFVIGYCIFTIIFYYHWQNYSMNKSATVTTYVAFFGISIPLLALMGFSLLAIH